MLGDQISDGRLSSLRDLDPRRDVVLMAEVMSEASYVRHHKQKFALVFSGMRQFADRLRDQGVVVRYVRLDDPANTHSLNGEVLRTLEHQPFERVVVTEPGEWRLVHAFEELAHLAPVPVELRSDDRFICSRAEFEAWATDGRSELRMEFFYRLMRRKTGLLMDGDKPVGGRWNFDAENRKRLPKGKPIPERHLIEPNGLTRQVMGEMSARFPDNFGTMDGFDFPTNPAEAEQALDHFITRHLPEFGDWQDFMKAGQPWMWHAHISAGMNLGLIDPLDACRRAEAECRAGRAPLNAVEGFVRQILGWREYVRGVYWLKGPEYKATNALGADRRCRGSTGRARRRWPAWPMW